jgi:hypothetical protein
MEIEILRKFYCCAPGALAGMNLFDMHFSVYNALYRLKQKGGAYLHLDPMRIRYLPLPAGGCGHYLPDSGEWCGMPVIDETLRRCGRHYPVRPEEYSLPVYDCLMEFYIDPENITFGKSPLLAKLMSGAVRFAVNRAAVDGALKFFGLRNPGMKSLKKRYRELAVKYHPDRNSGDCSKMIELNRSYEVLKEIFII